MKTAIGAAPALALAAASVVIPAVAGCPPEMVDAELANVQSRYYANSPRVAFVSVLASLKKCTANASLLIESRAIWIARVL